MPPMLVPRVTADPGQAPTLPAPSIAPARNAAPQQIEQLGEAMTRAGSVAFQTGQTIGDKVQETVDDANVRSAETALLQNGQQIVTDYTHKLGKDAMDAYQPATEALAKAQKDAMGTLTNDIQRRMFGYVSTNHLLSLGRQMGDHNFQQTVTYRIKEGNDSADSQLQWAASNYADWQRPDGNFAKSKKNGISEVVAVSQLSGAGPAQTKAAIRQKTSALADMVLTQMTGQEHYDEAQQYYDAAVKAGELDPGAITKWSTAITEGHGADRSKKAGQQDLQTVMGGSPDQQRIEPIPGGALNAAPTEPVEGPITDVMGSPRPGGRVHQGIDYGVPIGTKVLAPADGTVSRVWDDKLGGLSMEVSYPNGYREYFMHLSAQNYKEGQKITQGAVLGLSGQTGNATGPSVHRAMKDPDGNFVDPRSVGPAPKDPLTFTDPAMLEKALQLANARTDLTPREKSMEESYLERQYSIATGLKQQKYEEAKKAAVDLYYRQGGSIDGLAPGIKSQLTAEDLYRLNQPIPRKDDENTVLDLIAHPEKVVPGEIEKYRMNLSEDTYRRFFEQAQKSNSPDKVRSVEMDNNQLDAILLNNGLKALVAPKANTDDSAKKIQLVNSIRNQIDHEQMRKGGELSRDEKDKIMKDTIGDLTAPVYLDTAWQRTSNALMWPWQPPWESPNEPGYSIPYNQLTPSQSKRAYVMVNGQKVVLDSIPPDEREAARLALVKQNQPITPENIARMYVKHSAKKPQP